MRARATWGVQAGLLAGGTVAVVFLAVDLLHLAPLSTPTALGRTFFGPGGVRLDLPLPDLLEASISAGAGLAVVTVFHLLAFALLGAAAVGLFNVSGWTFRAWTGAVYGLIACTGVFYASLWIGGQATPAGVPGLVSVLAANALGGAVLGAYVRARQRGAL